MSDWTLEGRKDSRLVDADWAPASLQKIEGVRIKAIANMLGDRSRLTEIWRRDWLLDNQPIEQVFQSLLEPGAITAWHCHAHTLDRMFCALGRLKLVLFDARAESPTQGNVIELRIGEERPMLVTVPPGVWHGVACLGSRPALLVNLVDSAYDYDDPDHWRLPLDTPDIPYRFS
ncbi:dTDP-4-dehydrorhamnose 3,5-epimerase family protein [Pseudomonas sp. J452]|uniref:dTDP-4-dehydrorhamnose 3,5-epimerase family protein n=1 Tax=Pseudomonas sp. J452 TaxID=2898441 RepID=UPI0021ADE8D8|nr:dTDP-4-dehydrorhamnose 3,5-epimerase family protein [Pseudomonas sp. J452]UUY09033.1 dTDP-4-dehydrorhamnose 3,5-epimerase family protein [Pseudomonas sp. J452]